MGFAHSPGDLDDPLRRLPEAQDDFRIAATEIAVRIELREPEVLVRQGPEGIHRPADGGPPPLENPKERLPPTPVQRTHRICYHSSTWRHEPTRAPRVLVPLIL